MTGGIVIVTSVSSSPIEWTHQVLTTSWAVQTVQAATCWHFHSSSACLFAHCASCLSSSSSSPSYYGIYSCRLVQCKQRKSRPPLPATGAEESPKTYDTTFFLLARLQAHVERPTFCLKSTRQLSLLQQKVSIALHCTNWALWLSRSEQGVTHLIDSLLPMCDG